MIVFLGLVLGVCAELVVPVRKLMNAHFLEIDSPVSSKYSLELQIGSPFQSFDLELDLSSPSVTPK